MTRDILQFMFKLILVFILLYITDKGLGSILRYYYFTQESGADYRTTYALEKTVADIIIFGSSRAIHHYMPQIFESELYLSCYNAGRDDNFILYHTAILSGILKRYKPRIIILDLNPDDFIRQPRGYYYVRSLLPYYKTHDEVRPTIELIGRFEKIKLLSDIYPFNSKVLTIVTGNMKFGKKRHDDSNGYVPLYGSNIGNEDSFHKKTDDVEHIDANKINAYELFISKGVSCGARVYVIVSPYYGSTYPYRLTIPMAKMIASKYNVRFLDYSENRDFRNHSNYYYDSRHLNCEGSELFSLDVVKRLKNDFHPTMNFGD